MKPSEAVARLGLEPEDITDIVISHMHWDHADGVDLFPKARIWIQKMSWSITLARLGRPSKRLTALTPRM